MHLALLVVPGVEASSFWTLIAATWIAATVGTFLTWMFTAGTDDAFTAALRRFGAEARHRPRPGRRGGRVRAAGRGAVPGGPVGAAVGDDADAAPLGGERQPPAAGVDGAAAVHHTGQPAGHPARDLRRGARVPVVRPRARSRAGGQPPGRRRDHRGARQHRPRPARRRRRLDLQPVLRRRPDQHDDDEQGQPGPRVEGDPVQTVARFVVRPDGFARSIARTVVEVVRERFQARAQRRRDVVPRVHRSWTFALLRAVEQRGAAGPEHGDGRPPDAARRPERLRRLRGLRRGGAPRGRQPDRGAARCSRRWTSCWGCWRPSQQYAPRRYHFVVLSDHGQSQGPPFEARYGQSLSRPCAASSPARHVVSLEENVESLGSGRVRPRRPRERHRRGRATRPRGRLRGCSRAPRPTRATPTAGRPGRARVRQPRPGLRARAAAPHDGGDRASAGRGCCPGWPPAPGSASSR